MADSIRERIIKAVLVPLGAITTANGYSTDMGLRVHRGRMGFAKLDELPAISVFPRVETAEETAYGSTAHTMAVDVYGVAVCQPSEASVSSERILADLRLAMGAAGDLGGLASRVAYTGGGMEEYPDVTGQAVTVTASFEIHYETRRGDPYNQ